MENTGTGMRILVVEDEPGARNLISLALKHQGYSPDLAEDLGEAASLLRATGSKYAAMLIALQPQSGVRELIDLVKQLQPFVSVVGLVDTLDAVEEGLPLDSVVVKPITGENLRKALRNLAPRRIDKHGADEAGASVAFPPSAWRAEIQPIIAQVAAAHIPVLVQGETGSGKEILARQLHALSSRAKKPFLKVNCAALPSELIESELFGYERGAFTGAFKTTPGKFEMADGGTIFLDEIGDMDFRLQAKLLQVLQDSEFIRLGSSEPHKVDVRVIAATHCDLETAMADNRFREDLYYRLNVFSIYVPPLRERTDEILPLANFFMQKYATPAMPPLEIPPMLRDVLLAHDWPGNVRELENVIRRLLVVRRPDHVARGIQTRVRRINAPFVVSAAGMQRDLAAGMNAAVVNPVQEVAAQAAAAGGASLGRVVGGYARPASGSVHDNVSAIRDVSPLRNNGGGNGSGTIGIETATGWSVLDRVDHARREAETEAILNALNSTLWNRKRAAELLNIDYKALLYKMKKLGIVERAVTVAM
jgi:DNA-binding NtrC family response regulator